MVKSILITGATGTVGKITAKQLKQRGHTVIGVSRSIEKDDELFDEVYSLDLLKEKNLAELESAMTGIDAVFHLAWNLKAENFDTNGKWSGNMEIFHNVLESAENAEVPIFINGSSIHTVTGDISAYNIEASLETTPQPYKDSIDPKKDFDLRKDEPEKLLSALEDNPDSPYGESKIETEKEVKKSVENGKFRLGVSIRIGGVNAEDKEKLEGEPYYSSLYWSHKDIGRTTANILTSNDQRGYHQFYGVSDNEGRIFNIENSFTSIKN